MIKTKISIDLLNPGPKKVLYTVQGDEYSRGVDFAVYKNNVPYDELDSFSASFSFSKEDGTGGSYDQMPDGSVAYSISENIISVLIAPQVLTSPGFVDFSIKLTRNNEVLHTFSIKIFVQQNPGLSYISENYYKILGSLPDSGWQPNMYLGTDSRGNVVVKVGGGTGGGNSGGGIVFFPSVDKDGNLSWSNNGGLENPETVNISGDPGERGLSMYLLNASLAGSAEYYSFSDFVIPEGYVPKLNDLVLYRSGHLGYIHEVNMELESALVALIPGANLSGPSGERGVQGEPGKDGTSVTVKSVSESTVDGGSNVVTFSDGKTVTIKNGSKGSKGDTGADGAAGVSPTVAVSKSGKVTTVAITDKNGTKAATINDGTDGQPGKDGYSIFHTSEEATMDDWPFDPRFITTNGRELQPGDKLLTPAGKLFSIYAVSVGVIDASFVSLLKGDTGDTGAPGVSPTVSVSAITGGHRVTITDAAGTKSFDVMDGFPGISPSVLTYPTGNGYRVVITDAGGSHEIFINHGRTPEKGTDYWTEADKTEMVNDVIASLPSNPGATVTADSIKTALGYTPADADKVFEVSEMAMFTNLFDTVEIEYGKLISITDKTVSDTTANLATTGYIPVKSGDIIRVNEDFPIQNTGSPAYILYDANKTALQALRTDSIAESAYYVSLVEADANGYITAFKINKPSATAFIRICNDSRLIGNNPVLTVNEEITYEMGYGEKLNPKVKVDFSQITNAPQKNCWSILPYERLNIAYSSIGRKPINTVEHFTDAATNFGYNALKCDVRPTSDGELVCCHDAGFTFNSNGKITTYDSANSTAIRSVTAETVLGYSFPSGEHPCLVGDYLDVCRKYGKVAFITIRNEYMDVVIPKLLEELKAHNMTYSTIINCMTYNSLVQWRQQDQAVMINYTLNFGVAIDKAQIDRAIGLGYCSLCGFSLSSSSTDPSASCDFEYARANGIRLLEAIAYKEGSPEACYAMGYDGCQIGIPWGSPAGGGISEESVQNMIDSAIGGAIGGSY